MPGAVHAGTALVLADASGRILLLKRAGSHGEGTWAVPGGWVDAWEHPEQTIQREAYEELGITLKTPTFFRYTKDEFPDEDTECVCLWFYAKHTDYLGNPKIMEPHKATDLAWFYPTSIQAMPNDAVFGSTQHVISDLLYAPSPRPQMYDPWDKQLLRTI